MLTPTKVNDETMAGYVANIKARIKSATPGQKARAVSWYPVAHDLAEIIGNGDVRVGAGLLAALSVNKSWSLNKKLAADAAKGNVHGHMSIVLGWVRDILNGKDPMIVLPPDSKTWNFYRAIVDPLDPDTVVIDRHVHDAIVGKTYGNVRRGLSNKTRYATFAHAVRVAARELEMLPNEVQAILWITQTDMVRGTSTRPKNQGE